METRSVVTASSIRRRSAAWTIGADSEEKHEPASDIDTALVDSLKVLDPEGPIREADIVRGVRQVRSVPTGDMKLASINQRGPQLRRPYFLPRAIGEVRISFSERTIFSTVALYFLKCAVSR